MKVRLDKVEPYSSWRTGSLGDASNMLVRQYKFPEKYDTEVDVMCTADHDRCLMWDYDHARKAFTKHMGTGELGMSQWLRSGVSDKKVFAFLKDVLKADEHYPDVKWTGYRVTITVNRSNGFPVYTLALFCNKSGVPVDTDEGNTETMTVNDGVTSWSWGRA